MVCIDCDGTGKRQDAITGVVSWCPECGGDRPTMNSEPPSDAIGRAIVEALRLEEDDFSERPTWPAPSANDTIPCEGPKAVGE